MKITWLGQAGLLFEKDEFKIMIDPYLSGSVEKINPKNYRRVAVDEGFFAENNSAFFIFFNSFLYIFFAFAKHC